MIVAYCWCGRKLEVVYVEAPKKNCGPQFGSCAITYRCPEHNQNYMAMSMEAEAEVHRDREQEEKLAIAMHDEWLKTMKEQGYHRMMSATGNLCEKCRSDLLSWEKIPEEVQDRNRRSVTRLLRELAAISAQAPDIEVKVKVDIERSNLLRLAERLTETLRQALDSCVSVVSTIEGGPRGKTGTPNPT